jgi:hypothetical protein
MDNIYKVLEDKDGKILLFDTALKYLWRTGKGCNGVNLWSLLPNEIIVHIMNMFEPAILYYGDLKFSLATYKVWCLIDKRTEALTRKYFKIVIPHMSDLGSPIFIKNYSVNFIDVLLKNNYFDRKKFFNYLIRSVQKNRTYKGDFDQLHRIISLFIQRDEISDDLIYLKAACRFMSCENPFRDSYTVYLLLLNFPLVKIEGEYSNKKICFEPQQISHVYDFIKQTKNIKKLYELYSFHCEIEGIIMPKLIISDEVSNLPLTLKKYQKI